MCMQFVLATMLKYLHTDADTYTHAHMHARTYTQTGKRMPWAKSELFMLLLSRCQWKIPKKNSHELGPHRGAGVAAAAAGRAPSQY